jgi:hypothetical protein
MKSTRKHGIKFVGAIVQIWGGGSESQWYQEHTRKNSLNDVPYSFIIDDLFKTNLRGFFIGKGR